MSSEPSSHPAVLIIDDDEATGKTLSAILRKCGYSVDWMSSGRSALEFLQNGSPSSWLTVLLIDIRLPDMSGIDVLRKVKENHPETGAIMMTGNADTETAVTSLNAGAFAYIQKPYNIDEVKSLIEKILEKQRLVQENKVLMKRLQEWNVELERTVQEKTSELKAKNLILLEVIEKLKVLNELKSRFVANASHELQTPMTSILGFSSMLLDYWEKIEKAQVAKFLQIIRDEAQRLTRLSRDLLDLSRIQEGRMRLEIKKIDLLSLIERVRENMKMVKETVKIEVDIEKEARYILADQDKVQQIFTSLLGNALKYSPDQTRVRLSAKQRGKIVIVSVIDQGPGIPEDKREKIFEPFYRIHDDVGKRVRGTGLGLAIAKAIIEALGGVIRVEGQVGKGSNFTFILPKEAQQPHDEIQDE